MLIIFRRNWSTPPLLHADTSVLKYFYINDLLQKPTNCQQFFKARQQSNEDKRRLAGKITLVAKLR